MSLTQLLTAQQLDSSELQVVLQRVMSSADYSKDGMLPASVVAYDRSTGLATVKPLIQIVKVDGTVQDRHNLVNINVLSIGGGGFLINFPLKAGDLGWIIAGDRDLALFRQNLSNSAPNSSRPGSFADGLFVPDSFRNYTIADSDSNAMVIQTTDGTTKIAIESGQITLLAPTKVICDTPLAQFTQDVEIDGSLTVAELSTLNGGVTAKDGTTVTLPETTTINGINVSSHGHEQQNNGSGRTAAGMIE